MASGLQERIQELISEYMADFQPVGATSSGESPRVWFEQIPHLDEELARLQNMDKAVFAEISRRVARVSTHRNSLLPIHQLPPELLSYILEESLGHFDATPDPRTTKRLLALATVSRYWKDVLDQSPSAWGWIDIVRDASFAVKKSQNAPLSMNLVNEGELDTSKLEQGFATFLPHSKRWQSLQLHLSTIAARDFIQRFGPLSMPNLQDLGLVMNAKFVSDDQPTLENLDRYPLRHLVLSGINTTWDTVANLTELRSLKIANLCYGNTWLSRDHITNILLGCIHLEELAFSELENHPHDQSVPPPAQSTFYLPALKSVEFSKIFNSRDAGLWLLDCISAPNLRGLSVTGDRSSRVIGHTIASVLKRQRTDSPFPVIMASLRSRPVHVHMTQRMCSFDWELKRGVHQGLELNFPGGGFADAYQRVTNILLGAMGDPPHPPFTSKNFHKDTTQILTPTPPFLATFPPYLSSVSGKCPILKYSYSSYVPENPVTPPIITAQT
ncbi:hypothetical protein FS837_008178 [Tulasnella sp. UAMH 9824]|nr:hypothetical protein FS837_008178 [Tulasnella sp. UAMH 9824]